MKSGVERIYLIRMGIVLLAEAGVPLTRDIGDAVLNTALSCARAVRGREEARECRRHLSAITKRLADGNK